jgi:hypothetical protein
MAKNKTITSHELAARLFNTARQLLTRQPVELPGVEDAKITVEYYNRDEFLSTVKEMGSGKKDFGSYYFQFTPTDTILTLQIVRSQVCKKVQDEKWECEPLFTPDEFTVSAG